MKRSTSPPVTILTGTRGEGKSVFCRTLVQHTGVAGLLSPARERSSVERFGIDALIVPGEDRFPLARVTNLQAQRPGGRRDRPPGYILVDPPEDERFDTATVEAGVAVGPYLFSASALVRAGEALLRVAALSDTQLVVVDEIGPLELVREQGLIEPLRTLLRGDSEVPQRPLLVVVRPALVPALCRLVAAARPGCAPETISIRDFPAPGDPRVVGALA